MHPVIQWIVGQKLDCKEDKEPTMSEHGHEVKFTFRDAGADDLMDVLALLLHLGYPCPSHELSPVYRALLDDSHYRCILALVPGDDVLAAGADGSLRDHLAKTTEGPAKILGPGYVCGSLKPGRPADVAVIRTNGPWVWVSHLWIGGRKVYESHDPSGKGADEALRSPLSVEQRVSTRACLRTPRWIPAAGLALRR